MSVVAIVQARMGSTRLPGKVLLPIGNHRALYHTIVRTQAAVWKTVLAIPDTPENDILADAGQVWGVPVVRGSADDVLSRYWTAAQAFPADHYVRVTGDCPFLDVDVVRGVVAAYLARWPGVAQERYTHYGSNTQPRTFPKGVECEVFSRALLEVARRCAPAGHCREHVTPFMRDLNPNGGVLTNPTDLSHLRWTLDTKADHRFFQAVAERIDCQPPHPTMAELLDLLEREPALTKINTLKQVG